MRRITLTGDDLPGFVSASFDDHIKLLVPQQKGEVPGMPTLGDKGLVFPDGQPLPAMRDYTPRRYDALTNELDIDFVLQHQGPATNWATAAEVGQTLGIAGPRGSFVMPMAFDWYVLIGDETAIPAIGRRLEELPASAQALVIIKITDASARLEFAHQCAADIHWVVESSAADHTPSKLEEAVRQKVRLQAGEGHVWAAGEYSDIRAVRQYLVTELGMDKGRVRAASYWKRSQTDAHEQFDD